MSSKFTDKYVRSCLLSIDDYEYAHIEVKKELLTVTRTLLEAAEILLDSGAWMPEDKGGPSGLKPDQRKKAKQIVDQWGGL